MRLWIRDFLFFLILCDTVNAGLKVDGSLYVVVSGELAGVYEAWRQHKKLPLVTPANFLPKDGSEYLLRFMQIIRTQLRSGTVKKTSTNVVVQFDNEVCNDSIVVNLARAIEHEGEPSLTMED